MNKLLAALLVVALSGCATNGPSKPRPNVPVAVGADYVGSDMTALERDHYYIGFVENMYQRKGRSETISEVNMLKQKWYMCQVLYEVNGQGQNASLMAAHKRALMFGALSWGSSEGTSVIYNQVDTVLADIHSDRDNVIDAVVDNAGVFTKMCDDYVVEQEKIEAGKE